MNVVNTVCAQVSRDSQFSMVALRTDLFGYEQQFTVKHTSPSSAMSQYTREYGRTSSWYDKEWAPSSKHNARNNFSGWSKRGTRGNPAEFEGRFRQSDEGRHRESACGHGADVEVEVEVLGDRDKRHGCDGTREMLWRFRWRPQLATPHLSTSADMIRTKLWELQRLLNNRKGSLSATYEKKCRRQHQSLRSQPEDTAGSGYLGGRSEAAVNNSLGNLGCCVKEAAAAIHSLTCGIPDSQNNEIRYLKQASELIEEWQRQLQGVQPVNAQTSEHEYRGVSLAALC